MLARSRSAGEQDVASRRPTVMYHFERVDGASAGGNRRIRTILESLATWGVNIVYLQSPDRPPRWIKYNIVLSNVWYLLRCVDKVRRHGNVLVIDYSGRFHTLLFAFAVRWRRCARLVILVNSLNFAYRRWAVKNIVDRTVSRLFLGLADAVLTSGSALTRELVNLGVPRDRIRAVPPALRAEFQRFLPPCAGRRCSHGIAILWVGRVHPIKGLEYLLEAVAGLKDLPEVRLRLIGDDRLVPRYTWRLRNLIRRAGIAERVEFSGRIDAVEVVAGAYAAADIFVLPSLWDTSPIAVMEAMCFGLPVVATAAGGAGEWVENGVNGFVVPPRDSASLATAIRRLVEDAALRQRMGEASAQRSLAYRDRTWHEVAREYYDALRPLLEALPEPVRR